MNIDKFSLKIRQLLFNKRITGKVLAQHCGVTPQTISNWKNGRCCPKHSLTLPVATKLKIYSDDFITLKDCGL